jgi:hypothetical protein
MMATRAARIGYEIRVRELPRHAADTKGLDALGLPRLTSERGGPVGLALACVACVALGVAATNLDLQDAKLARRSSLPGD